MRRTDTWVIATAEAVKGLVENALLNTEQTASTYRIALNTVFSCFYAMENECKERGYLADTLEKRCWDLEHKLDRALRLMEKKRRPKRKKK